MEAVEGSKRYKHLPQNLLVLTAEMRSGLIGFVRDQNSCPWHYTLNHSTTFTPDDGEDIEHEEPIITGTVRLRRNGGFCTEFLGKRKCHQPKGYTQEITCNKCLHHRKEFAQQIAQQIHDAQQMHDGEGPVDDCVIQ